MQAWLVIGCLENWQTAFAQPIPLWGLRDSYTPLFETLKPGDLLVCYATSPVKGIIAVARIRDKYIDRATLIWPDEKRSGKIIWPLKFRLDEIQALPHSYWKAKPRDGRHPVPIADFNLNWQIGFQRLSADQVKKVFDRIRASWDGTDPETSGIPAELSIGEPEEATYQTLPTPAPQGSRDIHRTTQEVVSEAGRLQHYFTGDTVKCCG